MLRSVMEHWKWACCLRRREGDFARRRIQISLHAPDLKARRKDRNSFQLVAGADEEGGMGNGDAGTGDGEGSGSEGRSRGGSLIARGGAVWVGEGVGTMGRDKSKCSCEANLLGGRKDGMNEWLGQTF